MNQLIYDAVLWLLSTPIYVMRWVWGLTRQWHFWRIGYTAAITCSNCGSTVSLVGLWRCRCGYTYRGHLLRVCPVCGTLPRMARCFSCGVTERMPQP